MGDISQIKAEANGEASEEKAKEEEEEEPLKGMLIFCPDTFQSWMQLVHSIYWTL